MLSFDLKVKLNNIKTEYSKVGPVSERCDHFLNLLEQYNDVILLQTVLNEFSSFSYLPLIKSTIEECVNYAKENQNKYLVEQTINVIDRMNDPVAHTALKKLQVIMEQSEEDIVKSIRSLNEYDFLGPVVELRKAISYNNNGAKTTGEINVSSNIYSIVKNIDENTVLFNLDNRFYKLNKLDKTLEESFDKADNVYVDRVNFFKQFTVNENDYLFYHNNKEYKISEDKFYIAGQEITSDPVKMFESIDWSLGMGNTHIAHRLFDLFENRGDITHLDHVTRLQNKFDNVHLAFNLIKLDESLYVNTVNLVNGESKLDKVTDINECVEYLKTNLNYDISENIKEFKDKKEQMISESKNQKDAIIGQLTHLNEEILKYTEMEKTPENKMVIEYLKEELNKKSAELEQLQNNLNQSIVENLQDDGYIEALVEKNYNALKKGQKVYAFSQDITKKGEKEMVKCKTSNGTECEIPKGMLTVKAK